MRSDRSRSLVDYILRELFLRPVTHQPWSSERQLVYVCRLQESLIQSARATPSGTFDQASMLFSQHLSAAECIYILPHSCRPWVQVTR